MSLKGVKWPAQDHTASPWHCLVRFLCRIVNEAWMMSLIYFHALRWEEDRNCVALESVREKWLQCRVLGKWERELLMEQTQLRPEQAHSPWAVKRRALWIWKSSHHQTSGIRNLQPKLTEDPSMWPPERTCWHEWAVGRAQARTQGRAREGVSRPRLPELMYNWKHPNWTGLEKAPTPPAPADWPLHGGLWIASQ